MKLLILGAGGHGQVCKEIAEMSNKYDQIDFIDNNASSNYVVGTFNEFFSDKFNNYDEYFIGIGDIVFREKLISYLEKHNLNIATLISNNAFVSKSAKIGKGTIVSHGAIVNANSIIEEYCILGIGSKVDHNSYVEKNNYIHAGVLVEANTRYPIRTIGDNEVHKNYCTFDE